MSLVRQFRKTSLKSFLRSPVRTVTNLVKSAVNVCLSVALGLTGNPSIKYPDFQTQWEWQDQTQTDKVVTDMKYIIPHFLDQSSPLMDRSSGKEYQVKDAHGNPQFVPRSVMLNTVAPAAPISFIIYGWAAGVQDFPFYYTNVIKTFNGLRTKYTRDLYPSLQRKYGTQIVLLDTYPHFLQNILRENSSQYTDGIHFTLGEERPIPDTNPVQTKHIEGGQEYWGRAMALTMSYYKWLTLDSPGSLFTDVDTGAAVITLDVRAKADGIDTNIVEMTEHDSLNHGFSKYFPQDPITITYMEFDYEFDNDKSYYIRNGDNRAYMVRGDIRTMYEGNGGPDGKLGFPIQDEVTGSVFESFRTQNFECGSIMKNYFDLITPQKITMNESTPECLAKKARDAN